MDVGEQGPCFRWSSPYLQWTGGGPMIMGTAPIKGDHQVQTTRLVRPIANTFVQLTRSPKWSWTFRSFLDDHHPGGPLGASRDVPVRPCSHP